MFGIVMASMSAIGSNQTSIQHDPRLLTGATPTRVTKHEADLSPPGGAEFKKAQSYKYISPDVVTA